MKKSVVILLTVLSTCFPALAQDDAQKAAAEAAAALANAPKTEAAPVKPNYWTRSAKFDLGINQTSLTNWAAGGYNTVTLAAGMDAAANYAKDLISWNNRLQLDYGFLWSADKDNLIQKNKDRIYLESKLAYKTSQTSKWNYSASFDFRSQFSEGYDNYQQDQQTKKWSGDLKSALMSPAYTNIALGMDWVPAPWFNMSVSPLTGGFTICTVESLRKTYGMKLRESGLDPEVGANYRSSLFQFGAQMKANAKFTVNDVFTFDTQLVLFYDYLFDYNTYKNFPVRVNWDNKLSWQAAKFFNISLSTWLIYNPLIMIREKTSRIQFKEFFAVSFTYTIASKKK